LQEAAGAAARIPVLVRGVIERKKNVPALAACPGGGLVPPAGGRPDRLRFAHPLVRLGAPGWFRAFGRPAVSRNTREGVGP
jgi:hypothetical protein